MNNASEEPVTPTVRFWMATRALGAVFRRFARDAIEVRLAA